MNRMNIEEIFKEWHRQSVVRQLTSRRRKRRRKFWLDFEGHKVYAPSRNRCKSKPYLTRSEMKLLNRLTVPTPTIEVRKYCWIAVCKMCRYLVHSVDADTLKAKLEEHLVKSHKYPISINLPSLWEYSEIARIHRLKKEDFDSIDFNDSEFWDSFRK